MIYLFLPNVDLLISSRLNAGSLCAAAGSVEGDGRWVTAKRCVGAGEKAEEVSVSPSQVHLFESWPSYAKECYSHSLS